MVYTLFNSNLTEFKISPDMSRVDPSSQRDGKLTGIQSKIDNTSFQNASKRESRNFKIKPAVITQATMNTNQQSKSRNKSSLNQSVALESTSPKHLKVKITETPPINSVRNNNEVPSSQYNEQILVIND